MVTQKRCKVSLIQKIDETQTHGTMIFMLLLFLSSVIHVVWTRHEEQYVIFIMTGVQTCLGFSSFIIIWSVLFVLVYWIFFRFYCSFFHISLMIFRFLSPSFIYLFINSCFFLFYHRQTHCTTVQCVFDWKCERQPRHSLLYSSLFSMMCFLFSRLVYEFTCRLMNRSEQCRNAWETHSEPTDC